MRWYQCLSLAWPLVQKWLNILWIAINMGLALRLHAFVCCNGSRCGCKLWHLEKVALCDIDIKHLFQSQSSRPHLKTVQHMKACKPRAKPTQQHNTESQHYVCCHSVTQQDDLKIATNLVVSVPVLGMAFGLQKWCTSYIVDSHQIGLRQAQIDDCVEYDVRHILHSQ